MDASPAETSGSSRPGGSSRSGLAGARGEVLRTAGVSFLIVAGFCVFQLSVDPAFFWRDDFQAQYLPASLEVARALSEGTLPLLSPSSWVGGALAGEYQYAVFSIVSLAFDFLVWQLGWSLPATAALLSGLYLWILCAGSFRLARRSGLDTALSALVAIVASLNGWIIEWGATDWFPALRSFAWLPWFWWGLLRLSEPDRGVLRFLPAGLFLYLLIASGWPFTDLMAALISAFFGLRILLARRRILDLWPLAAAWATGVGLAAPALLMLVEYSAGGARKVLASYFDFMLVVPLKALPGLVLPTTVANWQTWSGSTPLRCLEMAGGLVPLVGLLAAFGRDRYAFVRRHVWLLLLLFASLCLMIGPGFGAFRFSFRWLPLFHLALALAGAQGLRFLRENPSKVEPSSARSRWRRLVGNPGGLAFLLILSVLIPVEILGWHSERGLFWALGLLAVAGLWSVVEVLESPSLGALRSAMPATLALVSLFSVYTLETPARTVNSFPISEALRRPEPFDPDLRYLQIYRWQDVRAPVEGTAYRLPNLSVAGLRLGNLPMLAGLDFVNGYSPIGSLTSRLFALRTHGDLFLQRLDSTIEKLAEPAGLPELMAIDALVVADGLPESIVRLEEGGWRRAGRVESAVVLRRHRQPLPRVRSVPSAARAPDSQDWWVSLHPPLLARNLGGEFAPQALAEARIGRVVEGRNSVSVEVAVAAGGADALIVFARPHLSGYEARLDGEVLEVVRADLVLPAVRLPAGASGRIELRYRPRSLVLGLSTSALTALVLLLVWVRARRRPAGR